jgi:hypothetical protein
MNKNSNQINPPNDLSLLNLSSFLFQRINNNIFSKAEDGEWNSKEEEYQNEKIMNENLPNSHEFEDNLNQDFLEKEKKQDDSNDSSRDKKTKTSEELIIEAGHITKEGVRFRCFFEGCSKVYKSKENLNLHIRNIHYMQKPYKCRFCSAAFSHRNGKNY